MYLPHCSLSNPTCHRVSVITTHEKVLFLAGSTWLQFGLVKHLADVAHMEHALFGFMRWSDYGVNDASIAQRNYYLKVTESQLRLAHVLNNYSLVDLYNPPSAVKSLSEARRDATLANFLVRPWHVK